MFCGSRGINFCVKFWWFLFEVIFNIDNVVFELFKGEDVFVFLSGVVF